MQNFYPKWFVFNLNKKQTKTKTKQNKKPKKKPPKKPQPKKTTKNPKTNKQKNKKTHAPPEVLFCTRRKKIEKKNKLIENSLAFRGNYCKLMDYH